MNIVKSPSPNFGSRVGYKPELIVVHITDGFFPSDVEWLRNPISQVSAHDVIAPDGTIHELVDATNAAWHAGRVLNPVATLKKNAQGGYINPNVFSYGIEVSCRGNATPTEAQMTALKDRIKERCALFGLPVDRAHVVGHREIYSGKTCPGLIDVDNLVFEITEPSRRMVDKEEFKKKVINFIESL